MENIFNNLENLPLVSEEEKIIKKSEELKEEGLEMQPLEIEKNKKQIHLNKTVTRNFIMDIVAGLQNTFGMNLTSYEKMVDKAMKQIQEEIKDKQMDWFRYEITQLGNGALSITFYGEVIE